MFFPLSQRGLIGSRLACRLLIKALSIPFLNNWLIFALCIVDSATESSKWLWVTSWWPGSTYCSTNCACRTPALRGRRTMTSSWRRTPRSWHAPTPWTCSMSSPCTHSWDRWTATLWSASTQWELKKKKKTCSRNGERWSDWLYRLKDLPFLRPLILLPRLSCLTSYLPMVNYQSHRSSQSRWLPPAGAGPAACR